MKAKGLEFSAVLYNTLFVPCADVGFTDEALEIFEDVKSLRTCVGPTVGLFCFFDYNIFLQWKVKEAEATLTEMLGAGFEPNIFVLNLLIQYYGKADRVDDVVRTFDRLRELGIFPDERSRVNANDLGPALEIYSDIMSRTPTQWSLHLKSLSIGASWTARHIWMNDLHKALKNGEELPSLLGINTGHGKHKFSEKGLADVFESLLKELNAPFHEVPDKVGWF
ncbi:hypothetical protein Pfo_013243 [Paulownia fortunei]|nr:hypothetical protein Pfo_013243 [Paulownia fortunei]